MSQRTIKTAVSAGLALGLVLPAAVFTSATSSFAAPASTALHAADVQEPTPSPSQPQPSDPPGATAEPSPTSAIPSDPAPQPLASAEPTETTKPNALTPSASPEPSPSNTTQPQSGSSTAARTPAPTQGSFRVSAPQKIGNGWTGLRIFEAGAVRSGGDNDLLRVTDDGYLMLYRRSTPTNFSSAYTIGGGWSTMAHLIGGIDFDGDGRADLIGINQDGQMILYRGNSSGTFSYYRQIGQGWSPASQVIGVDSGPGGYPALYAQFGSQVRVYATDGDGNWQGWDTVTLPGGSLSGLVASRDITGGGTSSLLRPNGTSVEVLHSANGLNFTSAGTIDTGVNLTRLVGTTGFGSTRAGTIDLIGEGNDFFALPVTYVGSAPNAPSQPTQAAGDLSGSYLRQSGQGWDASRTYAMGDTTGNGYPDLGLITASGDFLLYEGNANNTFSYPDTIGQGWSKMRHVITGIDFDGDTRMDVLAVSPDGTLRIYRTDSGHFTSSDQIGTNWAQFQRIWALRDGANGNPVLYALSPSGALRAYPTNGDGGFLTPVTLSGNYSYLADAASVDDWDKDGRSDFLSVANDGTLLLTRQSLNYELAAPQAVGQGWGGMQALLPGKIDANSQILFAIHADQRLFAYRFTYSGPNRDFNPIPAPQPANPQPQLSSGWNTLPVEWAGQPTGDTCGPTSMFMALRYLGAYRSAYDGSSLSVMTLAGPDYAAVGTGWSGGTSWENSRLSVGMNRWLGKNVYRQQSFPTGEEFRLAVVKMFNTNRPVLVDTVENYGGPHYNGHFNGYSSHIIVAYRYHGTTGVIGFKDPGGPGSALRGYSASREFDYDNLNRFAVNFLGDYGGGGHGMVY